MKHKVGRELCYDMFFLLSKSILTTSTDAKGEGELMLMTCEIEILKKVLHNVCRVIIRNEKVLHEDGKDFFTTEEWKALHAKVRKEKFKEERGAIEKGRLFATAYRTPMGKAVDEHMLNAIQAGYVGIYKGDITHAWLYEMRVYRAIIQVWDNRISSYKRNIERIRKIIYKEKQ